MGGTLSGHATDFESTPVLRPENARRLLKLPSSPSFFLKFHPQRWHFVGGEWLPVLGRMVLEPGVNRVDKNGNSELAEVHAQRDGWVKIPWEVIPGGYVKAYKGEKGTVHMSIWEHPRQVGNRVTVDVDTKGYTDFLHLLMDRGIIPSEPDPSVVEGRMDLLLQRAERISQRPESEGAKRALAKAEARIAAMSAGMPEEDGFEPAPVETSKEGDDAGE